MEALVAIKLVGDKFPSVCCGHQRLECGARWELHNIVCSRGRMASDLTTIINRWELHNIVCSRGRMASDLTTIINRDQGGGAPNLFTPILGPFTVDGDTWCGCPVRVRGGGVKREDLS